MDILTYQRLPLLEKENYGYWKVNMKAIIQGIDEDAWTAVEDGYKVPEFVERDGTSGVKPKSKWTKNEKSLSKFNAQALSTIFASVNKTQFKLIQGCSSAKEAWDKLEKVFEGTSKVKTCRLDMLASKFEMLKMEENETIEEFSSKLSSIASEAQNMGKKYRDKKLVKKLLRSLPPKFESKKTAMETALDTDQLDFDEVVGHLQAYEMEISSPKKEESKDLAFMSIERRGIHELMKVVNELIKQMEAWNRAGNPQENKGMKHIRRDVKCQGCQGYGHDKTNCPSLKIKEIKCYECGGFGHIKAQCVKASRKEKSVTTTDDLDSDDEDNGMVAFMGNIEEVSSSSVDDDKSDSSNSKIVVPDNWSDCSDIETVVPTDVEDDEDLNFEEQFYKLYDSWAVLREEKDALTEENLGLHLKVENLLKELTNEQERRRGLEVEIADTNKKIHKMNSGTKDLESIFAVGRVEKSRFGLGYNVRDTSETTKFIKGNTVFGEKNQTAGCSSSSIRVPTGNSGTIKNQSATCSNSSKIVPTGNADFCYRGTNQYGCYYCGKNGHIKRHCYKFKAKVRRLMSQERYYPYRNDSSFVFMRKDDIYEKDGDYLKSIKHGAKLHADYEFLNELCQPVRGRLLLSEGSNARLSNSIKKGEIVSAKDLQICRKRKVA